MNTKFLEAREYVTQAREALRRGDKESARQLGEQAALIAPEYEDAWLILAAAEPNLEDSLAYARKALEVNPESARARRGIEWASGRLKQAVPEQGRRAQAGNETSAIPLPRAQASGIPSRGTSREVNPPDRSKSNKRVWIYAGLFGLLTCVVLGFAAYSAVTHPAFASILPGMGNAPEPTRENLWAPVEIAKPEVTPLDASVFAPQVADTATPLPTDVPTSTPTAPPTSAPTEALTPTPEATETPGALAMEIVADTPTSDYVAPSAEAPQVQYPARGNGERWIDVNLTEQRVYAYEGDIIVNSFIVSTGTWRTPTVTGKYKIWIKLKSTTMSGPGYYLTNVPYTMYFYKGYGLHGTYWHNNFGTPMSHGCVNLRTDDAAWLYDWASVGTVVNVHY
jgi:lipoprotein-anchoring transpeptidase ErfK/SrfK